jgi:hypothetical protein
LLRRNARREWYGPFVAMKDERRHDSSRDLLEEIEDGWATPAAPHVRANVPRATGANPASAVAPKIGRATLLGGLTGTPAGSGSPAPPSEPFAPARSAPPAAVDDDEGSIGRASDPDLAALDERWLDDFPDDDDEDVEEPALPDERLDPEAFARAKKERDERAAKRRDKKRARAEAKRARTKARAEAARQKQKSKKSRPAAPAKARAEPESELVATAADVESGTPTPSRPPTKKAAHVARQRASTMASIRLLAIVLGVLLALAALAAVLTR